LIQDRDDFHRLRINDHDIVLRLEIPVTLIAWGPLIDLARQVIRLDVAGDPGSDPNWKVDLRGLNAAFDKHIVDARTRPTRQSTSAVLSAIPLNPIATIIGAPVVLLPISPLLFVPVAIAVALTPLVATAIVINASSAIIVSVASVIAIVDRVTNRSTLSHFVAANFVSFA